MGKEIESIKMKKMMIVLILLLLPVSVFATSSYVQYEGEGSLSIETSITSSVRPDLTDTSYVGAGPCPCEGCCEGDYSGYQYVSNNPFVWTSDYADVENGCINLHQEVIDYKEDEDQLITTEFHTGLEGTGSANLSTAAIPLNVYGYQYAQGSGETWAYFSQISEIGGSFDFGTVFGGGTYNCGYGYVEMEGENRVLNSPTIYSPVMMSMVCEDPGYVYGFLHGEATDYLNLNASVKMGNTNWFTEMGVEGSGQVDISTESNNGLDFDFDMVLG